MSAWYLLMDGRAHVDPQAALVLTVSQSLDEAREDRDSDAYGSGCAIAVIRDDGSIEVIE